MAANFQSSSVLPMASTDSPSKLEEKLFKGSAMTKRGAYAAISYMTCAVLLVIFNKAALSSYSFPSANVITLCQMICSCCFLYVLRRSKLISFSANESIAVAESYKTLVPTKTLIDTSPLALTYLLYMEFMTTEEKCYNFTLLAHTSEICSSRGKFTLLNKLIEKSVISLRSGVLNAPSLNYLKLLMMCGLFTLRSTEQALAGTDTASSLQSFSFLGDLGDISTGCQSVCTLNHFISFIEFYGLGLTVQPNHAFLLIFFSELGDKTFFIAALLAARNSAAVTFIGTFGALAVMTIISVVLGRTFHYVDDILPFSLPPGEKLSMQQLTFCYVIVTHSLTFMKLAPITGIFCVSCLLEASSSDGLKAEEEQKEAELAVSELSGSGAGILAAANTVFSTFL
ncbi:UNVERIFIED_CONTAM: protein PAM71, chloroplastic [Sesamum latifolium]|uniref:GDT1 family protein n=1 Tax=Sesamum latifolium TaxID=2727402 RepID=A0AAW2X3J2_9LAMI